jgi:UDP-N-acetylmuramyl pentapeptide phosphotransferase/UDP-N-acetylglucosamine-1-phosphate transferase
MRLEFEGLAVSSAVASSVISYLVTRATIRLCSSRGCVDLPNERSLHSRPVPRLGGIGILLGFLLSIGAIYIVNGTVLIKTWSSQTVALAVAVAVVLGTEGLYDDLHPLKAAQKFSIQFLFAVSIAVYAIRSGGGSSSLQGSLSPTIIVPLLVLWLVGFTNFYNFMDGVNGMAGAAGVLYGSFLSYCAWEQGQSTISIVAILAAGASLGFLFHNFPRARIFMGDAGSLFLGMLFSLLVILLYESSGSLRTLVFAAMLYAVFIYDCTMTLVRRLRHGENIFRAHHTHIYQRLVKQGWTHPQVTSLYVGLQILSGIAGVIYLHGHLVSRLIAVTTVIVSLAALTLVVYWIERKPLSVPPTGGSGSTSRRPIPGPDCHIAE